MVLLRLHGLVCVLRYGADQRNRLHVGRSEASGGCAGQPWSERSLPPAPSWHMTDHDTTALSPPLLDMASEFFPAQNLREALPVNWPSGLIHSLNKCLLNVFSMPSTVRDKPMNKAGQDPSL